MKDARFRKANWKTLREQLKGGYIASLFLSPDGSLLASRMREALLEQPPLGIVLRDARSGRVVRSIKQGLPPLVGSLAFSPDSETLAVGASQATTRSFTAPGGMKTMQTFSQETQVQLWNPRTGRQTRVVGVHGQAHNQITALAWSPDGKRLASAGMDGTLKLWRIRR